MIKPDDIESGKSYACHFTVRDIPLDEWDRPAGLYSLSDVPIKRTGDYEGFGFIRTRDTAQRLFEVEDTTKTRRTWIVSWDDCRDIDLVEWTEDE